MDFSNCKLSLHPQLKCRVASTESAYDTIAQEAWVRVVFHDPTLAPVAVVINDFESAVKRLRSVLSTYVSLPSLPGTLRRDYGRAASQGTQRLVNPPQITVSSPPGSVVQQPSIVDQ